MATRKERRAAKAHHIRLAKKASWYDPLIDKTEGYIDNIRSKGKSADNFKYFGKNDLLSICVFEFDKLYLLGFRRNTEERDIPWVVKQVWKKNIKFNDEFIFADLWGFEAFPPYESLIDGADMYWMMIPKEPISTSELDMNKFKLFPEIGTSNEDTEEEEETK